MRTAWLSISLFCCAWYFVLALRLCGRVAWPWLWVLSPLWVTPLLFIAFVVAVVVAARLIAAWVWLREVCRSRKRLRLWNRVQDRELRQLFIEHERTLRRQPPADPRECKPPFHRR